MAPRRDNMELVWSITELSSLFERKTNTDGFLQEVVDHVSSHLESDVCSIYLLDESQGRLVLRATKGLDPHSVGKVMLELGEGITGTAVKELRPIREARGTKNPSFKLIPETNEDRYQSFLAVPIRRGLNRIGALVVQHQKPDQFTRQDTRALQAIAGQLAATLENAEIMMELHARSRPQQVREQPIADQIDCQVASEGVAIGRVSHLRSIDLFAHDGNPGFLNHDQEGLFVEALERTDRQLEMLHRELDERLADVASLIFGTHLLMLRDEEFSGQMIAAIRAGAAAHEAVRQVTDQYVSLLAASSNARTQEKSQDVRDLGSRLLRNLAPTDDEHGDLRGKVIISHEMFPSDLVRIAAEHAEGVILTGAGATAHITILARSLEIPAVLLREPREANLHDGDFVAVDAYEGHIHRNPSPRVLEQFEKAQEAHRQRDEPTDAAPAVTKDGTKIELLANVNILHDVEVATRVGAQGIGLYRSEFPFLVRNDFPSEDEQYNIYRRITERFSEGPLVFRTLDVGGDKLFGEAQFIESNPFLGLRGIRFSLAHPEIFDEQIRAMLRAGVNRELRVLFPMIATVDEFVAARARVEAVLFDLAEEGLPHNHAPKLGVMIELPSAVEVADVLAREADFLSIGSNDLVMYLLAVDRANEHVEQLYQPFHPPVLRALKRTIEAARKAKCPVSMCGEIGGNPAMLHFLIGCGLRTVSADPGRLGTIRSLVASINLRSAEHFAKKALRASRLAQVEELLRTINE
ncbi:MAG: phosphoenolpyruvate--protein phosphotransferase [Spirochaetota bacterium]